MSELYRAIAGSPITYLAADISANQTTISIVDDSALPDAPNICTIGYGENIETIRYGAKSNGVLQNVTRGLEGTPRAWKSGTEVARFYTAYDHNAIVETITSHLADYATHEHDGNDAPYIKWDNVSGKPDLPRVIEYREIPMGATHNFGSLAIDRVYLVAASRTWAGATLWVVMPGPKSVFKIHGDGQQGVAAFDGSNFTYKAHAGGGEFVRIIPL